MISGKYLNGAQPEGARLTIETRKEHRIHPQTDAAIVRYIELAKRHKLDVCQMAIAFVLSRPFVASALIGATNLTQLETDINALSVKLPDELLDEINAIHRDIFTTKHAHKSH